jgi:hypothetical protein
VAVTVGRRVSTDEPAALAASAGLLLLARSLLAADGRRALLGCAAGGLLLGSATAMRTIHAPLLALPVAVLVLGAARLRGARPTCVRLSAVAAGLAVPSAVVCLLLVRSGLSPWPWTAYGLWSPWFSSSRTTFGVEYALRRRIELWASAGVVPLSNLELAGRLLLGLPGLTPSSRLGLLWPAAGWLAALPLWRGARLRQGRAGDAAPWLALAATGWVVAHLIVFCLYFYPAARFYLPVLVLPPVLLGAAVGQLHGRSSRAGAVALIAIVVLGWMAPTTSGVAPRRPASYVPDTERALPRRVGEWVRLDDEERAQRRVRFDPVYAQALGLLTPEVVARIDVWGKLPRTTQVIRLLHTGRLDRGEVEREPSKHRARSTVSR